MTSSREQGTLWTLLTTTTTAITSPAVNVSTQQNLTPTHTHTHSFPLSVWGNQTRSAFYCPTQSGQSAVPAALLTRALAFHFFLILAVHFTTFSLLLGASLADNVGQRCVFLNLVMHVRFLVVAVVESALVIESLMFFSSLRLGEVSS